LVFALALVALVAASSVVDLTPDNFDSIVDGSKNVFVEFYAPWCGHCKNLAPAWEQLADAFKGQDSVVIAKVDADSHRDLGTRFGVSGFPTLKFFSKGGDLKEPKAYEGARELDDLVKYVGEETGARGKLAPKPVSKVAVLTPDNFDAIVLDKSKTVFVEFYAPWCGHCKHLAPDWDKLGLAFQNEPNVVIAKVDADAHRSVGEKYGVTGFPTLKFFPAGNKEPEAYEAGRDLDTLVAQVNSRAGTKRTTKGTYEPTVGRDPDLDELAQKFIASGSDHAKLIKQAEQVINRNSDTNLQWYVKFMNAIDKKGNVWIANERARVEGYLSEGKVDAKKIDELSVRLNILEAFKSA